jgi:hypothetical protein
MGAPERRVGSRDGGEAPSHNKQGAPTPRWAQLRGTPAQGLPGSEQCRRDPEQGTASSKRVPPSLTSCAPGNTPRGARRVGTLERYLTVTDVLEVAASWACMEGSSSGGPARPVVTGDRPVVTTGLAPRADS